MFVILTPITRVRFIVAELPVLARKHFDNPAVNEEYHRALGRIEYELERLAEELAPGAERCEKCGEFCATVLLDDAGNCPDCKYDLAVLADGDEDRERNYPCDCERDGE